MVVTNLADFVHYETGVPAYFPGSGMCTPATPDADDHGALPCLPRRAASSSSDRPVGTRPSRCAHGWGRLTFDDIGGPGLAADCLHRRPQRHLGTADACCTGGRVGHTTGLAAVVVAVFMIRHSPHSDAVSYWSVARSPRTPTSSGLIPASPISI
jgi:hypothetical protein